MDREKVINGLRVCFTQKDCDRCPYQKELKAILDKPHNDDWCCPILADAIAMLKEQETEIKRRDKPVCPEIEGGGAAWFFVCGACHGVIDQPDKFCKHCGTAVCWTV